MGRAKVIKRLGVFMIAASIFQWNTIDTYATERSSIKETIETVEVTETATIEVLEEVSVTEVIEPMTTVKASGALDNLNWSVANNTLTITGSGEMSEFSWSQDYPWMRYSEEITKVVVGDYVTGIGQYAFSIMPNVETVTLGSRLKSIGAYAFHGCTKLMSVAIPNRVEKIGSNAFSYCSSLKDVSFGQESKLESIGYEAFYKCEKLEAVDLPESLTTIGEYLFRDCFSLHSVKLGSKVHTIYRYAFAHCEKLKNIELPDTIKIIGQSAFFECINLNSVNIPDGIEEIGHYAFYGCENLGGEIVIPKTVTTLGTYAFAKCNKIESAVINIMGDIPEALFMECPSLKQVTIAETVTNIGDSAFYENQSLEKIAIPSSVKKIGEKAFMECISLTEAVLKDNLVEIGKYAFHSTALTTIEIPNTVTSVGLYAFENCTALEKAVLSTKLTKLQNKTFYNCTSLKEVVWSDNIQIIGNDVFSGCTNLVIKSWPQGLTSIGEYAFYNNDKLRNLQLPESVTRIGYAAFEECSALKYVTILKNVTSVENYAFRGCTSLVTYTAYSPIIEYGNKVFDGTEVTIKGWNDSTTQTFANKNSIAFKPITVTNNTIYNVVSGPYINWDAVQGAEYYTIYRSNTKDGTYAVIKEKVTNTYYIDTTAVSGKKNYYKVEARNGNAKTPLSSARGSNYVGTPDITGRVNMGAGIKITWNKIEGATGYAVYRKDYSGKGSWECLTTISGNNIFTWTDESVKANNGQAYKYTVRALIGSNMDILSGCRENGRSMVRLTSRTLNSAKKATANSIKCSWTTSDKVTGYEMRFMDGDKVVKIVTVGNYKTGVKTFNGLAKGKKYKVQVRSYKKVDGVGSFYSAWSVAKNVQL